MPAPTTTAIIADLNRAKAVFQLRAICAAIGLPPSPESLDRPSDTAADAQPVSGVGRALCASFHPISISETGA